MSRNINPRFPPKQKKTSIDSRRWVVIGNLPEPTRKEFWKKAKAAAPDIVAMRREGGRLLSVFNAAFQIPQEKYQQIMEVTL